MIPIVAGEIDKAVSESVAPVDPGSEDALLVAAARNREAQAFEILVGRHRGRILRVVQQFTRNREDAEDVVQQAFQKAFLHLQQFEGNSAFSTWLTRIAINEALMWLRKKRAAPEVSIEESTEEHVTKHPLDSTDPGPSPEDSYLQREWEQILSRAMKQLTPAIRTAVELRDLGELSTDETAGVMKVSASAVKARVFHGRKKLRLLLERYFQSTHSLEDRQRQRAESRRTSTRQQLVCSACE
ncbi:MAG TPA: sigma-70 family RNA polymerase sigma factor [Candidatus Acidoferrum sp.]